MKTVALAVFLLISLAGCAATGVPSQELITGDVAGNINTETVSETTINQITWWQQMLIVFLAGVAIPSFGEMWRGLVGGLGSLVTLWRKF